MTKRTIAALAREAQVGVETVRFYQRRGLLRTPRRPKGEGLSGGFREYTDDDVRRLRFIRSAQAAGFTLEQIRELLALDATNDRQRARELAKERLAALDAKIIELQTARDALQRLAYQCRSSAVGPCPIIVAFAERAPRHDDANARVANTRSR